MLQCIFLYPLDFGFLTLGWMGKSERMWFWWISATPKFWVRVISGVPRCCFFKRIHYDLSFFVYDRYHPPQTSGPILCGQMVIFAHFRQFLHVKNSRNRWNWTLKNFFLKYFIANVVRTKVAYGSVLQNSSVYSRFHAPLDELCKRLYSIELR